jgi:hypothetical protein
MIAVRLLGTVARRIGGQHTEPGAARELEETEARQLVALGLVTVLAPAPPATRPALVVDADPVARHGDPVSAKRKR